MNRLSLLICATLTTLAARAAELSLDFTTSPDTAAMEFAAGDDLFIKFSDEAVFNVSIDAETCAFGNAKSFCARDAAKGIFATIVSEASALTVELRDVPNSRLYRARISNGCATTEAIDLSNVHRGDCIEIEAPEIEAPIETTPDDIGTKPLMAVAGNPFDDNIVAPAPVTIDLMMVFDKSAAAWVANSAQYASITNFAIAQVAKMNSVLANTGLETAFWYRLVDVMTVDTTYTAVDNQILGIVKAGAESGNGPYGPIKERRAACGADLVTLMIDTGSAYGTTGIGYITHGTNYNTWLGYRAWCYSCCAIRSVDLEYTLSHEVGHNMGLAHSPTLASWTKPGTFDYSNGYNFWGKDDNKPYHTIMAYDQDRNYTGYKEIPYFSSPEHTYQGTVIGTVLSNDCTRALRETCSAFAAWHEQTLPLPSDVSISPAGSTACTITLSNIGGFPMRYTIDGSTPTLDSPLYEKPILLASGSATVKAACVVNAETLGAVAERTYTAAVEARQYALLAEPADSWKNGSWRDQDGNAIDRSTWYLPSDTVAILAQNSHIEVDTAIDIGSLILANNEPYRIATASKLSVTNLEVAGAATLYGSNFAFENWRLHPASTLVLSPGAGQSYTYDKNLALSDETAKIVVSNGTVTATAKGSGSGVFGAAALSIANGGTLVIGSDGWKTGYQTATPLTIETGGTMRIDATEAIHRTLQMAGGTIDINAAPTGRALDFYDLAINVTEDSLIKASNPNGYIAIRQTDTPIHVANGKTFTIEARFTDGGSGLQSNGRGIVKNGGGTLVLAREPAYSGETIISNGTLRVEYVSSTTNAMGWSVCNSGTLEIASGASLAVPSLALESGAALSLPASSAGAPLAVSNSVDLAKIAISLTGADDLSLGASYPLVATSGKIQHLEKIDNSNLPALDKSLAWKLHIAGGNTLCATVTTPEEAVGALQIVSNDASLALEIPEDATIASGSATITSTPLLVDEINDTAVTFSLDIEIPHTLANSERTICSWTILQTTQNGTNTHTVRCVQRQDGILDVFYNGTGHVQNAVPEVFLSPGRHTVKIGYNYGTHCGTRIFVDETEAYYGNGLKWSESPVGKFEIGNSFPKLTVHGIGILKANHSGALPNMTASPGVTYNYLAAATNTPAIFPNTVAGGFSMNDSLLDAAIPNMTNSISVSIVAAFPANESGTLIGVWTKADNNYSYTSQVEYDGNGKFSTRYNGYESQNPARQLAEPDSSVEKPHLYTFTYAVDEGFKFYQDGIQILEATDGFAGKNYEVHHKVTFGRGPWNNYTTSYNDCEDPMKHLKVYASHIELGTDDRTVSEKAVMDSLNFNAAYDKLSLASRLAYLPGNQNPLGVAVPLVTPTLPCVDILVGYDKGAQEYLSAKGVSLHDFAAAQIDKMNAALATNRLDECYSYRLAGVCKVDESYSDINQTVSLIAEGAGPCITLRASRELCGADTVTFLVKTSGAYLGHSSPLTSRTNIAACHDDAFSVCSIAAVDTGKQHTMLHENAHNMGCGHSRSQSSNPGPSIFPYGSGYYFTDLDGKKRHTIMAYGGDGDASWFFSTSSDGFGLKLGDELNDNARVLRETCSAVASWRETHLAGENSVAVEIAGTDEAVVSGRAFSGSITLSMSAPAGRKIIYTLDGSEPTENSLLYTAPITLGDTATLTVACTDGLTMSPARTIRLYKLPSLPGGAVWQTGTMYPWRDNGDSTIRSVNHTEYNYKATMPLMATIEGPKRLSFSHKSYFMPASIEPGNYSHFDILLDDSPIHSQTEYTNEWTAASIDIPEGVHTIAFIFSQRNAMNNPSDYKDGTPEADDAVWLKNITIEDDKETDTIYIESSSPVALADTPFAIMETSQIVKIAFADGIVPANGQVLVTWQTPPAGSFSLADSALAADWHLAKYEDALRIYQMPSASAENVFTVPGTDFRFVPDMNVVEWINGYMEGITDIQEFFEEEGSNGYPRWISYALGMDPDRDAAIDAAIALDNGSIVINTAPAARQIDGLVIRTTIYGAPELAPPLPKIKEVRGTTVELEPFPENPGKGFYKAVLELEY